MIFPFLTIFLVFIIFLAIRYRKSDAAQKAVDDAFWDKEQKAKTAPDVDLDSISYIEIPLDRMPLDCTEDPTLLSLENDLRDLSEKRILRLTGITNTDVKLKFGTANFDEVCTYGENYDKLVKLLDQYAYNLLPLGFVDEATSVLEYAVGIGSDLSNTYNQLCDLYKEQAAFDKISNLIPLAEKLTTPMKASIIKHLSESLPVEEEEAPEEPAPAKTSLEHTPEYEAFVKKYNLKL